MEIRVSVTEVAQIFKEIQESPGKIFEMVRLNIKEDVGKYLSNLMNTELTYFLGRDKYERKRGGKNYRNGNYCRNFCIKGVGDVEVKVPRDRKCKFETRVIPKSRQYEEKIGEDLSLMYLTGISTRSLSLLSQRLIGRKLSHGEISNTHKDLEKSVEKWRNRDLSTEEIKYMFVDGVNFDMRISGSVEKTPVLAAIGVTKKGHKTVLGIQMGDKESAGNWREFFKDLKKRGLDGSRMELGIMDGLPGLEKVFKEEFPRAKVQRCQVHVARNVLSKVPKKLKEGVADDIRSIFYASSKAKAVELFDKFQEKRKRELPSATKCLAQSIDSCLTFLDFPEEEWISLRTTNIIERLNKEFKRRTKSMEIVAGESSCYKLLAFISIKMELNWRSNPVGKVRPNLPFFQIYTK